MLYPMLDLQTALTVAVAAAKSAGKRILAGYGEELVVHTKPDDAADKVTQVDLEAQERIVERITAQYPDHGVMGEEDLCVRKDATYRWIIDPLDGTSNYTRRLPHVGVSIALQHEGKSVVGVLYFPVYDDTYTAVKGGGAFCNGAPIHVSPCEKMRDAYIAEVFSDRQCRGRSVVYPPCVAYRKFGSAITSCAYVAAGHVHATALQCHLWDIAAADVIIREAGGRVEWALNTSGKERESLTFYAATPGIFDEFRAFAEGQYVRSSAER